MEDPPVPGTARGRTAPVAGRGAGALRPAGGGDLPLVQRSGPPVEPPRRGSGPLDGDVGGDGAGGAGDAGPVSRGATEEPDDEVPAHWHEEEPEPEDEDGAEDVEAEEVDTEGAVDEAAGATAEVEPPAGEPAEKVQAEEAPEEDAGEPDVETVSDLSDVVPGMIAMVEVPAESYLPSVTQIVQSLMKDGSKGIVVNVSRPYQTLVDVFDQKGVSVDELRFVDCISRLVQADTEESDTTIFLDSPTMLELMAMGVDHFIPEVGEGGFVLFESYGSLTQYNNFELVYEFTNFLVNKLRLRRVRGLLVVVRDQLPDNARGSLAQLSDMVVRWRSAK